MPMMKLPRGRKETARPWLSVNDGGAMRSSRTDVTSTIDQSRVTLGVRGRRLSPRRWKALVAKNIVGLAVLFVPVAAKAGRLDRRLERPAAQAFLPPRTTATSSFIERAITWPADGKMDFDYFVDSEANHDYFRVYVDGVVKFEASGSNRSGRASVDVPSGTHTIRFEYFKDNTGNFGLDTAWVDNIRCETCGQIFATFRFNERDAGGGGGTTPPGWTGGGTGGGWKVGAPAAGRGIRRPVTLAFLGYQAVERKSNLQRTIVWPAGSAHNTFTFDYFVDSEQGHDFLKVYVDNVVKFTISGRNQTARATIDVGAAGGHTIKFEYVKDVSVDVGLDDARVDNVICNSDGGVFERDTFDGVEVGGIPAGWTPGDGCFHDDGWVGANPRLPRVYLAGGTPAPLPVPDGVLSRNNEYASPTRLLLADYGSTTGAPGELLLEESDGNSSLFFALRAHSNTREKGNEKGEITLYVDTNHFATQKGFGCGWKSVSPGLEDRRFKIAYNAAAGQTQATVSVVQEIGTCGGLLGSWRPAVLWEKWPITVAIRESTDDDDGFLHIEAKIGHGFGSDAVAAKKIGFAFVLQAQGPSGAAGVIPTLVRLPWTDGAPPLADDVSTWESVFFGNSQVDDLKGLRVDGAPRG